MKIQSPSKIWSALLILMLMLAAMPVTPAYAADTGLLSPTASINGTGGNAWTNPNNGFTSNNVYATAANGGRFVNYTNFGISIPAGGVIDGIAVVAEGSTTGRDIDITLSWNNGVTYTALTNLNFGAAPDQILTAGGPTSTWGRTWNSATDFTNANFRVRITTTNGGGQFNLDHVQVRVYYSLPPEINVQGNGISIVDGDATPSAADWTDFGNVPQNLFVDRTFTIQNTGTGDLSIGAITFTGGDTGDFSVVSAPAATVAPGNSTTFTVRLTAGGGGGATRDTTINIANNDANENPYNFGVQGTRINAEINVQGNGNTINDGDGTPSLADCTNFGSIGLGGFIDCTYTIQNQGPAAANVLSVGTITIGGANAADFSVTVPPTSPIANGASTTFTVRFTPSVAGARNATISFINNDTNESPYNWSIQGTGIANNPPTTTGISNVNVVEDAANTSIDLWPSFADAQDTDAQLTYTVTGNTNAGLFSSVTAPAPGGQFLVLDYAPDANGTANITVRATDTGGLFVETTFAVTISAVNDPPSFTSAPVTSVNQNDPYVYNVVVTDPDVGDTLVIDASTLPAWLTFTDNGNGTAALSGTPSNSDLGMHTVVLRVTDGIIPVPVEQSFSVVVDDVNDAPSFTSAPVTTVGESTPYTYNIVTTDPDGGDTLTITATTLPVWLTLVDNGDRTATLSGTPNSSQAGVHNVVLEVSDSALTATQTFDITVGNTAPQISANGINTLANTGDGVLAEAEVVTVGVNQLIAKFDQDVYNPAGDTDPNDVTNPANYLLVRDNGDGFQTTSCALKVSAQDTAITIDLVTYSDGGGLGPFVSTLLVNNGLPLSNGNYRLYVCGTTSIVDVVDNTLELAGDGVNPGTDFVRNFTVSISNNGDTSSGGGGGKKGNNSAVSTSGLLIPVTGFAPGQVTKLPAQPVDKAYKPLKELRIEIPTLGINFPIVGVAKSETGWDLTWLQNSVAYLEGSAYPTLKGNTVLTAHVTDASNNLGPFSDIKGMKVGQQILIHFNGQVFVYQVQENRKVSPSNLSAVFEHEEYDWITLVTCENYNARSGSYKYRRMVRAVLISVVPEK